LSWALIQSKCRARAADFFTAKDGAAYRKRCDGPAIMRQMQELKIVRQGQ